jgi:hypothetical protein
LQLFNHVGGRKQASHIDIAAKESVFYSNNFGAASGRCVRAVVVYRLWA